MHIYPDYNKIQGSHNFDICLIQTPEDGNGIKTDLSVPYDLIPCLLTEEIDLSEVFLFKIRCFQIEIIFKKIDILVIIFLLKSEIPPAAPRFQINVIGIENRV